MPRTEPPEDSERSLEEHLRELTRCLSIVIIQLVVLTLMFFPISGDVIQFLKYDLLPPDIDLIVLNPLEFVYMRFQLSIVFALTFTIPTIIWEAYRFMKPGLFPGEKKFFLKVVPTSFLLFLIGGIFSYEILVPLSLGSLIDYSRDAVIPMLTLTRFISFVSFMLLSLGIIFQFPLIISFLVKSNLMTVSTLKEKRKFVYLGMVAFSMLISPESTFITPFLIALSMIVIYEISLVFANRLL
jgi:sec-independent protein translocase protein TatC